LIESLYFDFGTQLVLGDLGFPLQNRGALFSLDPEHPNCLAPGKRPLHTLMPALVLHPDGGLHLVLGTMGGEGQPQTQLALLTRVLDFGFDPYTAIDLPRWLWGRTWGETAANLCLEGRITATVQEGLRERGHPVQVTSAWDQRMGHAQMIRINRPGGRLEGSSDRRSDGAALGL
jgi:gamma-glutamyltranspeptidase/glutathione hydrolase